LILSTDLFKMQLFRTLAHLSLLSPILASPRVPAEDDDSPLPLIIWHGLGDTFQGDGIQWTAELAQKVHEGTFVHVISLAGNDASADRSATFWGNVTEQLDVVCAELAAHPILSTAPAVDALGFSQGGVFLRGFVERCNFPKVRSLVTFGSPHNGIIDFTACGATDWLCKSAMGFLKQNTWSSFIQGRLVPAQYFRTQDPEDSSKASEDFLEYSNYLADVNNERLAKNATYAANLASLENFAMYLFDNDTTVVPANSAWWDDVDLVTGKVTPLKERAIYSEDWVGLKQLDAKGGLKFKTAPGRHMELDEELLIATFKEFYGPVKKSKTSEKLKVQEPMNLEF
jgi:palmitoyl-protein thioesterase